MHQLWERISAQGPSIFKGKIFVFIISIHSVFDIRIKLKVSLLHCVTVIFQMITDKKKVDVEIMLDSGIRHAADAMKAISLGAKAVLIGRPYAYALAAGGQRGVEAYPIFAHL